MSYLLSCASSRTNTWETSAARISEIYGWGQNRQRVKKAIERVVKDERLIIRGCLRNGTLVRNRTAYVVCAGGRRFTAEELMQWSTPIDLPPRRKAA
jgi:hypothetical protein